MPRLQIGFTPFCDMVHLKKAMFNAKIFSNFAIILGGGDQSSNKISSYCLRSNEDLLFLDNAPAVVRPLGGVCTVMSWQRCQAQLAVSVLSKNWRQWSY